MIHFIRSAGNWGILLVILLAVILVQVVRKAIHISRHKGGDSFDLESSIHSILFWGGFSALLGIYGQLSGIYKALKVIIEATAIAPRIIAMGLAESFTSTLFGLGNLIFAALAWYWLIHAYRRRLKTLN
jgi:hypothetical protein